MPKKLDHDQCREKVCVVCIRKASRNLSENDVILIRLYVREDFEKTDPDLPCGICNGCFMLLRKKSKDTEIVLPIVPFVPDRTRQLRSSDECPCKICVVAKTNFNESKQMKKKKGRPKRLPEPNVVKMCSKCFTVIYQGCVHQCKKNKKIENLEKMITSTSPTTSKKLSARLSTQQSSSNKRKSADLPAASVKRKLFVSLDDMCIIRKNMDLSARKTRELAHYLRVASGSSEAVESHLNERIHEDNHRLDDLFGHEMMLFLEEDSKKKIKRNYREHAIVVKDVNELVKTVLEKRHLHKDDALIRVGLDGGGGFLKVCLSAFDMHAQTTETSAIAKKFKDSGVKKALILGITPGVQENYMNMKKLWLEIGLHRLQYNYTIATDLKLCNIMLGLMNHSSMHPCCWCDTNMYNLHKKGNQRTFGSLLELFFNFYDANVDRSKAKDFGNVIHTSIIDVDSEDQSTPVIHKVPPPELHLLLGPTQHLYDSLSKVWPGCDAWLASINITKSEYYGGCFEGNDCRNFLKNISSLEARCPEEFRQYIDTFKTFDDVVRSCYGYDLAEKYKDTIAKFKTEFLNLKISVTPKVHAVFFHIEEFCDFSGTGLGPYSEQTSEALHHEFKKCWENYYVKDTSNSAYPERFLAAVRKFNSLNI